MADQTRQEILQTARRLFATQGYTATSVGQIAEEAGVAVQTIYARLGSKQGMLLSLIDMIDDESGLGEAVQRVQRASTPEAVIDAEVRLTRGFHERCGDVIGSLFAAAAVEADIGAAVAEARRRHREGARLTAEKIAATGRLRKGLTLDRAAALLATATAHEAWRELTVAYEMTWDQAEGLLSASLRRALLP